MTSLINALTFVAIVVVLMKGSEARKITTEVPYHEIVTGAIISTDVPYYEMVSGAIIGKSLGQGPSRPRPGMEPQTPAQTSPSTKVCNKGYERSVCRGASVSIWHNSTSYTFLVLCSMDAEIDICRGALLNVHYFDNGTTSSSCEEGIIGGCDVNANNFEDIKSCVATCGYMDYITSSDHDYETSLLDDVCRMEAQPGPCQASEPRYFYNSDTSSCEEFTYGGCEGNANNFKDSGSCRIACA